MGTARIFNFSAGPSMLPLEVLQTAGAEIENYRGSGMSVMEMSHRSGVYTEIFSSAQSALRRVLNVPDQYKILFLQGGATLQFAMVPMNLMGRTGKASYAITGNFSNKAAQEAKKYGTVVVAASTADKNHTYIPRQEALNIDPGSSYFHYCANNTIYGTEWDYVPETGGIPIVCDMSSNILSKPVDVSKYGIIYAGAQKNMAPAGLTVVIIREDLAGGAFPYTPVMLDYAAMIQGNSMHNTPPCYNIYILGLVLQWLESIGGLPEMQKRNEKKAGMLYHCLEESRMFHVLAEPGARSKMNVTFRTGDAALDERFAKEAAVAGFVNLKGHRSAGGMRASIYNAMPVEGVEKLVGFMREFERKNG
ncbi:MAG: 3-phosphoserine/phosphohydroxythreonine transaminase [Oscillospiraceae bacterium]|nr:3-phosphoserine/phosphohydroxythreonine transaminase [Oscillospiraceae bacterium]